MQKCEFSVIVHKIDLQFLVLCFTNVPVCFEASVKKTWTKRNLDAIIDIITLTGFFGGGVCFIHHTDAWQCMGGNIVKELKDPQCLPKMWK